MLFFVDSTLELGIFWGAQIGRSYEGQCREHRITQRMLFGTEANCSGEFVAFFKPNNMEGIYVYLLLRCPTQEAI